MLRKGLIAGFFAAMLSINVFAADVVVRVAPPRAVVETRVPAPGPGYVWTPGYQRWDGRAYVWAPGAWVMPPHAACPLGGPSLGSSQRRLGIRGRPLALEP